MLQLMDLARENAALRSELKRVRDEAKALRLLVVNPIDPPPPRFRQAMLADIEE